MIRLSRVALATTLVVAATAATAQNNRFEVGALECRGSTTSFVVGSVTNLTCVFRSADNSPPEPYNATIRRAGVDIGFPQQVVVGWVVWAPTRGLQRGDLSGSYVGASASATVGIGVGANGLIGGSNNTIALQPLSGQAQAGLSVAAGVAGMDLRPGR